MKYTLFTSALFSVLFAVAQDFHMAQFDADPLGLNPALTGERLTGGSSLRFNLNYRDQRANFTQSTGSYKTLSQGADLPVGNRFSIGEHFMNMTSINRVFRVNAFQLSGAYRVIRDESDKQFLSVGLQVGVIAKNFESPALTYGAQYDPTASGSFNQTLPSGEVVNRNAEIAPSANFGLYYRLRFGDGITAWAGGAMHNITKPYVTAIGQKGKVPLRFVIHGGFMCPLNEDFTLQPQFMYMEQNQASELNLGTLLSYRLNEQNQVLGGISWRTKNALILQAGLTMKGNAIRFSYCIVNNTLAAYQNRAFEISLVHISPKKPKTVVQPRDLAPGGTGN